MAKELPYFKFEPAEYLTKDISFCSLPAQGLFINICSYYWQRKCSLTKDQLLKRLDYENELNELISEGVIDLIDNKIRVKFLDKQLDEVEKTSEKNKVNGSKGGRPKKNPEETQIKPKLNPTESEKKGIREDKIILDEIREDEPKENIIDNSIFLKESLTSEQWIEAMASQAKITVIGIKYFLPHFDEHLITCEEQKESLKEYKKHFANWLKKQDVSMFHNGYTGKTNQI